MQALKDGQLVKYEALGNDYLVLAVANEASVVSQAQIRQLCDRHCGLGSDGLLVHVPYAGADAAARLRIFNPDGSEAEKSGNGLRIFARYLADFGFATEPEFLIALGSERIAATLHDFVAAGAHRLAQMSSISLAMGKYRLGAAAVAYEGQSDNAGQVALVLDDEPIDATLVSMGNPHCVVFNVAPSVENLRRIGPKLERHPKFRNRTNVQLAKVVDRRTLSMMIWERGAEETSASGSSSCAAAVAAFVRGLCDDEISVHMPGGTLDVTIAQDGGVSLRGVCRPVFMTTAFGLTA